METLENRIKRFLSCNYNSAREDREDSVYGDDYSKGNNFGYGCGDNCPNGDGAGCMCGAGYICGGGSGYPYDYISPYCIKELNGDKVYVIDNIPTIIKSLHNNIAQGFILNVDFTICPCYIVKEQNKFAHGDTLHDAFISLQEKLYNDSTEEERIKAFCEKFPEYDTPYPNRDLFIYHNILTGSCRMGRETFMADKGLSLDGKTSIRKFVELTKNSYGGDIIKKLPMVYRLDN